MATTTPGPLVPADRVRAFGTARQGLSGDGFAGVVDAVRAVGGVYGSSPTCYLSLAARIDGFTLGDLDDALYERRTAVRLRAQRQMAYVQPVDDLPGLLAATEPGAKGTASILRQMGTGYAEYDAAAALVDAAMTGREPMTVAEIRAALGDAPEAEHARLVVALMTREARLVRTRPRGSWRSDGYGYARWSDWIGDPVAPVDPAAARVALARRYLAALGPATPADLRWWTGWKAGETKAVLAALDAEGATAPVRIAYPDAEPEPALILAADAEALATAETTESVRLLPYWDCYPMGYADRRRIAGPAEHDRVFDRVGNATSMVLVDGAAGGVWQAGYDAWPRRLTVTVAPFGPGAGRRRDIEDAAARLAAAVEADELALEWAGERARLADGVRNTFMSPVTLGVAVGGGA